VALSGSIPYTFTAGTVAKSAEVNSNFGYLIARSWDLNSTSLYYSGGNVGIGESSPQALLQVGGTSGGSKGKIVFGNTFGANAYIAVAANDGNWFQMVSTVSGGNIEFRTNRGHWLFMDTDGTELIRIKQKGDGCDGCVGIGTTTVSYPIHLASGAYVSSGGAWTNASSRKYKDNITELSTDDAVNALSGLTPVTFTYKKDKSESHVGFIAEDVPQLVATKDRKGLSPMDITAVLTKVVQQQQDQLKLQQEMLNRQQAELVRLSQKIESMSHETDRAGK
jgi:hypothetical protein